MTSSNTTTNFGHSPNHAWKTIVTWLVDKSLGLVIFLLVVTVILSWSIMPDCWLESNRTAILTHRTLYDWFTPCLNGIRPFLPKGGLIVSEQSPVIIDYSVFVLMVILEAVRRLARYGISRVLPG